MEMLGDLCTSSPLLTFRGFLRVANFIALFVNFLDGFDGPTLVNYGQLASIFLGIVS